MKKLIILTAVIISALTGCKTQQQAGTVTNDDVYASPKYSSKTVQPNHQNVDLSAPQQVATPDSVSRAKSGSATWYDDYSDYSNSSSRQAAPTKTGSSSGSGNSYVDPSIYDNSYSSNPDVNVYLGSSYDPFFWGSSVSIGCGFGWGWDSYYWGYPYPSWYYPYYGYYPYAYGYGGYWNGYWNGYNDGYWDGHHGNPYYNTYSTYYGQRRMLTSGGSGNIHGGSRIVTPGVTPIDQTRGNISSQRITNVNGTSTTNRSTDPGRSGINSSTQGKITPSGRNQADPGAHTGVTPTPADRQHYRFDRSKVNQAPANQRTGTSTTDNRQNNKGDLFSTKDSRSGDRSTGTRTVATQNYSSPAYRQPKYSQEYINPRSQSSKNTGSRESNVQARSSGSDNRGYVAPSSNNRRYSAGYNSNSQRGYGAPSRSSSSSGYSSPSRSYSTPGSGGSRSGGGGGNHSSSSRGGSGGSGSSGGSGGGRRK